MEAERAILEGLERIDGLRREDAPAGVLLDAVRSLLADAEEWVREDPAVPAAATCAIERSREALAAGQKRSETALAMGGKGGSRPGPGCATPEGVVIAQEWPRAPEKRGPCQTSKNARKFGRILFDFGVFLHNGCVQDCTSTGRSGDA